MTWSPFANLCMMTQSCKLKCCVAQQEKIRVSESKADEWSRLIAKTKNPEHLVCNLVETLSEYATENWASEFLSSICYQLEKQEEIRGSEDTG